MRVLQSLLTILRLAAILATIGSSSASAQVAKLSATYCNGLTCSRGSGSCVNIGEHGDREYFLTVGHAVLQPDASKVTVAIHLDDGVHEARVEAADMNPDLAVISIPATGSCRPFSLAQVLDEEQYDLVGFTGGGPYVKRTAMRVRRGGDHAVFRVRVRGGDSGGPFLDSQNRIAAICWGGTDDGETYATDCVRIRGWMKARIGFIPGSRPVAPEPPAPPPEFNPPQRPRPTPDSHPASSPGPTPDHSAGPCECAYCIERLADLQRQINALKSRCDAPAPTPAPVPAEKPDLSGIDAKLVELEARIKQTGELTKRIDALEFKIREVQLAGGKTEQLEKELAAIRDLTFDVRSLAPDGTVVDSRRLKLGDPIDLRLVPKKL